MLSRSLLPTTNRSYALRPRDDVAVNYTRTHWYGLGYFLRWYGSLIPRSLPAMALSGAIAGILEAGILDDAIGWDLTSWFEDPFSMQMFGVVFGYLSISRLTTTYNRYWEGVTHVNALAVT